MGYQKLIIEGNLGKDPEIKNFEGPKGASKCANFSVAVSETYKKGDEKITETEWFNCQVWGKLADVAEVFLKKGASVICEGKLKTHSFNKDDGTQGYFTTFKVTEFKFTGKKAQDESTEEPPETDKGVNEEDELPF